jgi:hypothetical protein
MLTIQASLGFRLKMAQEKAPKEFKVFYECMDYYRYVCA